MWSDSIAIFDPYNNILGEDTNMNFKQYIKWRLICFIEDKLRRCDECQGSNGHCTECNEWHHLFRRDWQKTYWRRKW